MEDTFYVTDKKEPEVRDLVFTTAEGIVLPGIQPANLKVEVYRETENSHILHEPAVRIDEDRARSDGFRKMVAAACATMYNPQHPGIGIAANQIGLAYAFCIIDTAWPTVKRANPRVLLNPNIVEGDQFVHSREGCLSVPLGYSTSVRRASRVVVEYRDLDWNQQTWVAEGMDAFCVQHEYDHLNGTLFIDRLSRERRRLFENKLNKLIRRFEKQEKALNDRLRRAVKFNEKILKARRERAKRMGYEDPSSEEHDGLQGAEGADVCGVHDGEPESPGA